MIEDRVVLGGVPTRRLTLPGDGRPLLLLHGYADTADTWRGVLRCLARRGRAAVAVDLPLLRAGGRARPASRLLPQLDAIAADAVRAVADDHGTAPVLVGNSMGACTATRAAADPALPVAALVSVADAMGMVQARAGRALFRASTWRAAGLVTRDWRLPDHRVRAVAQRRITGILYGDPRAADPAEVARFEHAFRDWAAVRATLEDVIDFAHELSPGHRHHALRAPVLFLHGRRDRIVPFRGGMRLHELTPGSRLLVHPDWGHCPQLDDPVRFTDIVVEFADEVAPEQGVPE